MRALTALALFLLAGCPLKTETDDALAGSRWTITAIDGDATADPRKTRLEFKSGQLAANIGCNGISGPWRVENGRLVAGPLIQTEIYCEGPVWQQEKALSALLASAPRIALEEDRLTLLSNGHDARMERINPPQSAR